jgi:hypothetical protein
VREKLQIAKTAEEQVFQYAVLTAEIDLEDIYLNIKSFLNIIYFIILVF